MWPSCTPSSSSSTSSLCTTGPNSMSRLPSPSTLAEVQDVQWSASKQVFPPRSFYLKCLLLVTEQVVLCQIMLRRRKDQIINGKALIELPKRTVNVVSCVFDASEKNFYDSLETKMESVVEKLMATNKGKNNYISVLLLLLRLRQGIFIYFFSHQVWLLFCKPATTPSW